MIEQEVQIRMVIGGYIITDRLGGEHICITLGDIFNWITKYYYKRIYQNRIETEKP